MPEKRAFSVIDHVWIAMADGVRLSARLWLPDAATAPAVLEYIPYRKGDSYRGVRQQFVKLAGARGDQVAVVSGAKAGEEVVSSGVFKLRNGAAVRVNNKIQPGNDPAPKPEDK